MKFITWTTFLYLAYCGSLFIMQRQILFPRNLVEFPQIPDQKIPGMEKMWIDMPGGKVEAWFIPPVSGREDEPAPAVIFAHGNAELIDYWPEQLRMFSLMGIGVLLVEYPGYGRSQGTPSQHSVTEAFVTAYDILTARKDVDPSRIILIGRSIGGGAICQLAAKRPSAALILMSTFTSIRSFASKYLIPGFLVRDPLDNQTVVSSYSGPVLVVHGKNDETVPYMHGTVLFQAAKHGKMISYDAGHNDCPPDWNTFWNEIEAFLYKSGIIKKLT